MTPLVLLHGFTGAPSTWDEVVARLGDRPVFAPWVGGHGQPATPCGETFEAEVDRLAAQIDERGTPPSHLVGYSLGARLSLGLLVRHPRLFARATLIGVNAGLASPAAREERLSSDARWVELLETQGLEAFVEAWSSQPLFASQPASERDRRRQHTPQGLALSLRALGLGAMPDWTPVLSSLRLPVTFVAGALDVKFAAVAQALAAQVEHGRSELVVGSGHNVVLERPDAIASLLERESS